MRIPLTIALTAVMLAACAASLAQQNDREFLLQATQRTQEYVEAFHDLTAEETMTIRYTDLRGRPVEDRTLVSSLIIYRSQADARKAIEYRDVETVDGKPVKDHAKRAVKLLEGITDAKSAADELDRITKEGTRYNRNVMTVNMTLVQGLPLLPKCLHTFAFRYLRSENVRGIPTRVYFYSQTQDCETSGYRLSLPAEYENNPKTHRGTLWLEEGTARLVREERDVYASNRKKPPDQVRVTHAVFDYQRSSFDILTPVTISIVGYRITGRMTDDGPETLPRVFVEQKYGPFSRFAVSVEQKVEEPKEK